MLIRNNRTQKIIFWLSLLSLIGLTSLNLMHNTFLTMLDNFSAQLSNNMLSPFPRTILKIIYFFNHGFGALMLISLIIVCLWRVNYKLPAFWISITSLCGGFILHLLNLLIPATSLHQSVQFPSFGLFWATFIYSFVAIFITPDIKSTSLRFLMQLFMLISWLGTFTASLFQQNILLSGILAGWLLALSVIEFFEMQYVKYAAYFARMNGFIDTWY